jgi:hypothetical protein
VIGPADVQVAEGANTIVYAWGSLDDDNLALAVQTITDMQSSPHGVPAGSAGLVATNAPGQAMGVWIGAAVVLVLVGVGSTLGLRRRASIARQER